MINSAKLSSGVRVTGLYDTLTHSNKANIATKDKKALLEENKIPLNDTIKTAPQSEDSRKNYIKVVFEDEKSHQLVSTKLSFSNVLLLKQNFKGENDFFVRNDGVLRLNGEAQNFISGWFEKVAYDMNLLAADRDKNALVSGDELLDSFAYQKPYFQGDSLNVKNMSQLALRGGEKIPFALSTAEYLEVSIQDALNSFVSLDKNANNKISFVEYFGGEKFLLSKAQMDISNCESSGKVSLLKMILEQLKRLQEELEASMLENDENIEEKALKQGLEALNVAQLQEFKSQNPVEYERLAQRQDFKPNEDLKSLENALNKDFIEQIRVKNLSIIDLKA